MNCLVCCEKFKKTSKTQCRYCDYVFCKDCGKKYISGLKLNEEFNCLNCHHQWTFEDLVSMFPRNFINTKIKEKQMDMYFEYEKTFLPRAQRTIELVKQRELINKLYGVRKILQNRDYGLTKIFEDMFVIFKQTINMSKTKHDVIKTSLEYQRNELFKMIQNVENVMQAHVKRLEEMGVSIKKQ